MTESIELKAGELRLALRADLGAAIAGLWLGDEPVLRSTEPALMDSARASGCFATLPFGDRLGLRRFRWQGADHRLATEDGGGAHALDGVGWLQPWQVRAASTTAIELVCIHAADARWPFAFEAVQRVELAADGLKLHAHLRNTAADAQPAGLGWRMNIQRRTRSRLHAEVTDRWDTDATGLPTRLVSQPGIDANLAHLAFDHCFEGWTGPARLRDERFSLRLSSSLNRLLVHTPADQASYCVQPIGHVPNAIHMADPFAHGLHRLQPGEAIEAWLRLEVTGA